MVIAFPDISWFKCTLTSRSVANAYGRRDGPLGEQFRDRCHGLRRAGQGGHPVLGKIPPGIHHRAELLHGAGILPLPSGGLRALQGSAAAACPRIVPLSGTEGHLRVNAISPGPILCKGGPWELYSKTNPEWVEEQRLKIPLKRLGCPTEVAAVAVFLASPLASFVTGTNMLVDGGIHVGTQF